MVVHKGMQYRVYPTQEQESFLRRISGCVRLVYNLALEQRQVFSRRGRSIAYAAQCGELGALKDYADFLREVPHHCLQQGLKDLNTAYERFFKGISAYPTPRRKGVNDSFRFPDASQFTVEPCEDRKYALLHLPKMGASNRKNDYGALRVRLHRPLEGVVKSATLGHVAGVWHVSFLCEVEQAQPALSNMSVIGLDRGVAVPMMVSDGTRHCSGNALTMPYVPVPTKRQRLRERRLHKALSRCKMGSENRRKAKSNLARCKAAEARRRKDAIHKATTHLAKNHGLIVIEDLRVSNMTKSAKGTLDQPGRNVAQKAGLNRAILSVGWGMMSTMLGYKCDWYGSELMRVPAWGTSQTCSECWVRDARSRASRSLFSCTSCGHTEHADLNAAKVIRGLGLGYEMKALATPEDTCPVAACGALCAPRCTSVVGKEYGEDAGKSRLVSREGEAPPFMAGSSHNKVFCCMFSLE